MKRIVFTIAVGKPKFAECALGLGRSLKLIGDTTHRVVLTDLDDMPWEDCFDEVIPYTGDIKWIFFEKLTALDRTDADQILFIDSDSLVFRRLDPIFEAGNGNGFCVQGEWISSGDWYGDVAETCRTRGVEAIGQFNGGMIYYERSEEVRSFFDKVDELGRQAKELGFQRDDPLVPDEPCIGLALAETGFGTLWPDNTDFQNSATGLIGKLDLDVMRNRCGFLCRRYGVRYVEPIIFHASRYINFLIYWKQLDRLQWLSEYEKKHGFGYMSPGHKLKRSIHKRLIKWWIRP
jgi:hypothetical protein